jgi:hypothetical protein
VSTGPLNVGSKSRQSILTLVLWIIAVAVALALAYHEYASLQGTTPVGPDGVGGDFWGVWHAANLIAAGKSPYDFAHIHQGTGYVYSPFAALILLPFRHLSLAFLWRSWTALSIGALVTSGALVTQHESPRERSWYRPVLFLFMALTSLVFMPTRLEFFNGQADTFVLLLLLASLFALDRAKWATSGALIGVAAVIKSWPGGVALTLLRRDVTSKARAFTGFGATLVVAPILALAVNGTSGLARLLKITFAASSQHDASYSVWGAPRLLFTSSGLARPFIVSTPLEVLSAVVLAVVVLALLVLALRWSDSPFLSFWNVTACVVLLLPVSHLNYSILLLPILWIWTCRSLAAGKVSDVSFAMTIIMLAWWCTLFRWSWVQFSSESALRYAAPFFVNLVAAATSVFADHHRRLSHEGELSPTEDAAPVIKG